MPVLNYLVIDIEFKSKKESEKYIFQSTNIFLDLQSCELLYAYCSYTQYFLITVLLKMYREPTPYAHIFI